MSDSLIEQVRKIAEAHGKYTRRELLGWDRFTEAAGPFDFPALLAHMQAQQAVVEAAREFMAADWFIDTEPLTAKELAQVYKLRDALFAALEKVKP